MSDVKSQYEAYPYPARDPADEKSRLIMGSPSHPLEMDHYLFGGMRDWSKPLRALFAGGGTGDGLIQLATILTKVGKPYEITYIDLSNASRKTAEARAKMRGLTGINFTTGSLLDAGDLGEFDYIDCCGVLHHLPDPAAGFRALRGALAPGGGMGMMVYAPYGRSGVYPLQEAFGTLFDGLDPEARLKSARKVMDQLPDGHPFKSNPNLGDHKDSDAGFYDLLLHSQDRAYSVSEFLEILSDTGWSLSGFCTPALYDLGLLADVPAGMDPRDQWVLAEKLRGTIKTHVAYVVADDAARNPAKGTNRSLVPHLNGVDPRGLANAIASGQKPKLSTTGLDAQLYLPKTSAPMIAAINGRNSLEQIAQLAKADPIAFGAMWNQIETELTRWGLMWYSNLLR